MNCLIVKNDGLGDLVLSSGLISSFTQHYKGSVDLITCIENQEIAEKIEGLSHVFYVSRDSIDINLETKKILATGFDKLTINKLKQKKYDHAIILRRFIRRSALALMQVINAEHKFCCWQFSTNINYKSAKTLTDNWKHIQMDNTLINETLYFHDFINQALGFTLNIKPKLKNSKNTHTNILNNPPDNLIGLGVSGRGFEKEKWFNLIELLIKNNHTPVLFGGNELLIKDEWNYIDYFFPKLINLIGRTSISSFLNISKNIKTFIGNDTGITHLASLNIPKCLIIYGGGTFGRFFPWPNSKNQFIIYRSMDCFDCDWKCKYDENHCLNSITSNHVYDYFKDITNNQAEPIRNLNKTTSDYELHWQYPSNKPVHSNCHDVLTNTLKGKPLSLKDKAETKPSSIHYNKETRPPLKPRTYIFGTGAYGRLAFETLSDTFDFIGFIDNDPTKHNKVIQGLKIFNPNTLLNLDSITVFIASQHQTQMIHQLIEMNIPFSSIKTIPYKTIASMYCLKI